MINVDKHLSTNDLLGIDLTGWHLERWYIVGYSGDEFENYRGIKGFFKDKDLAIVACEGDRYAEIVEIVVLTKDSQVGWVVDEVVELSPEEALRQAAIARAKEKLTPEDRKLLNIE